MSRTRRFVHMRALVRGIRWLPAIAILAFGCRGEQGAAIAGSRPTIPTTSVRQHVDTAGHPEACTLGGLPAGTYTVRVGSFTDPVTGYTLRIGRR